MGKNHLGPTRLYKEKPGYNKSEKKRETVMILLFLVYLLILLAFIDWLLFLIMMGFGGFFEVFDGLAIGEAISISLEVADNFSRYFLGYILSSLWRCSTATTYFQVFSFFG